MTARPPLFRPIRVNEIPPQGLRLEVVASDAERAALAEQDGVGRIDSLTADVALTPGRGGSIAVAGTVRATLNQTCVVTLEPFDSVMEEPIEMRFAPAETAAAAPEDDPADPIEGGVVDVGAVVAEFFALGLDPYPRRPDAAFEDHLEDASQEASPFAQLKAALEAKRANDR